MTETTSYRARAPQLDRAEVELGGMVCVIADRGHRAGTVARMPHPGDPNEMLSVLFEDEDFPREVRLRDVHAVAAQVTVTDANNVLVTFFNTGVTTNGTPGRLTVMLYGNGDFSLVCDGHPCGGGKHVVPAGSVEASRHYAVVAERTALQALAALCDSDSDSFEVHALDRVAMRRFVELRRAELDNPQGGR